MLSEYGSRWVIENGTKDLVMNYFFDNNPGIDPHRINIHYFVVALAGTLCSGLIADRINTLRLSDMSDTATQGPKFSTPGRHPKKIP